MNAGLDAAIGDYVYEFDSTELCYPASLIFEAYRTALTGSDIVSVCPRTVRGGSGLFYKLFNANSQSAISCAPMRSASSPGGPSTGSMLPVRTCLPQGGLRGQRPEDDRS